MNLKFGAAGQRVEESDFSLTLKLPNLLVRHNRVDDLHSIQGIKCFIWQKIAFGIALIGIALTGARERGMAGAKMQLTAAGLNRFVKQLIDMNFAER